MLKHKSCTVLCLTVPKKISGADWRMIPKEIQIKKIKTWQDWEGKITWKSGSRHKARGSRVTNGKYFLMEGTEKNGRFPSEGKSWESLTDSVDNE